MRRAFCVFSTAFGLEDDLTQAAYMQMCKIEKTLDTGLDRIPYQNVTQFINQLENEQIPMNLLNTAA